MNIQLLLRFFATLSVAFLILLTTPATQAQAGSIKILGPGGGTFATIQDAVNAAQPGATVLVVGGTHAENVVIPKPLTLRGTAHATIRVATGVAIVVSNPAGAVAIEGFRLETQSTTHPVVFYDGLNDDAANLGTIQNCEIIGGNIGMMFRECDAKVHHNQFRGNTLRGLQVLGGVGVSTQISNNTFTGQFAVSGVLQNTIANGFSAFNVTAKITGNTFQNLAFGFAVNNQTTGYARGNDLIDVGTGIDVLFSPGFAVLENTCFHQAPLTATLIAAFRLSQHINLRDSAGAVVKNNTLTGANVGVLVSQNSPNATIQDNLIRDTLRVGGNAGTGIKFLFTSAQGAQIHGNNFENNETFAVHDFAASGFTIDATNNWWGSPSGPSAISPNAVVSPNVVFTPFLTAPNLNAGA